MQKDIQKSKGETQKFDTQTFSTDKPTVGETVGHKMKEVGHDINAGLKENVGVGVGNYSSFEDRKESEKQGKKFEEKKEDLKERAYDTKEDVKEKAYETKEDVKQTTAPIGHKIGEVAHDVNASLKQNVGIGFGNYSSDKDEKLSQEHKEKYEEGIQPVKEKVNDVQQRAYEAKEDVKDTLIQKKDDIKATVSQTTEQIKDTLAQKTEQIKQTLSQKTDELIQKKDEIKETLIQKKDEIKETLSQKTDELIEKAHEGQMGLYTHKIEEVGRLVNAKMKETIGVGIGDYPSEVDRQKAEEHNKEYMEIVKESSKVEVSDSNPIVHKIKEVAHTVNANLKEMIGVGVGNYSSEVDRELSELHHKKYEEKSQNAELGIGTNFDEKKDKLEEKLFPETSTSGTSTSKQFEEKKEKLEEKLFPEKSTKDEQKF